MGEITIKNYFRATVKQSRKNGRVQHVQCQEPCRGRPERVGGRDHHGELLHGGPFQHH